MELSEKLKFLRKKMGLSQLTLSEKLHVSRQAVSSWEAGTSRPSTDSLKGLGALYNVSLEYLLDDDVPEPKTQMEMSDGKESSRGINIKRNNIVLILIGIGIIAVILCTIFFQGRDEKPKQMNQMERSEVETENKSEFDVEF